MLKIALLLPLLGFSFYLTAQSGTLVVNIKGINAGKKGELYTGIFVRENFPTEGKQLIGRVDPVTGSQAQVVFQKVPAGTYGVVCFHDIDKDKKLKKNLVGYPVEPIAFSRDAKMRFGPPEFDDAKVVIEANKTLTITITLK